MIEAKFNKKIQHFVLIILSLLSMPGFASPKQITVMDLFTPLSPTEPWNKGVLTATKTVNFQQAASGGTDATTVSKVTLAYFMSANCTGPKAGGGFYTTPNGTSFSISVGTPFGLVAASTWNVGSTQLNIIDMGVIHSVAVTLKSTNSTVPQANFSSNSFACIPVTCASNACTSASGTQSFELKTTAAIGDPAEGGIIACMNGGLNNLIVPATDNSIGIEWGGSGTLTNATSTFDGASNTTTIVTSLGVGTNYAAGLCSAYEATGGYNSGWFLPAGNNMTPSGQLYCLYINQVAIGGFSVSGYWSSSEASATTARRQGFVNGNQLSVNKSNELSVRCAKTFNL